MTMTFDPSQIVPIVLVVMLLMIAAAWRAGLINNDKQK